MKSTSRFHASAINLVRTQCWALLLVLLAAGALLTPSPARAFDIEDLSMQQKRQVFYKHGSSPTHTAGVAAKHPNMPVIMAHMKGKDIDVIVKLLRKHPNLYIQHSHTYQKGPDGMVTRERLVKDGLAHKIVFGTDLQEDHSPMVAERRKLRMEFEKMGLDEKTIDGIMFGTIENMLKNVVRPEKAAD